MVITVTYIYINTRKYLFIHDYTNIILRVLLVNCYISVRYEKQNGARNLTDLHNYINLKLT